MPDNPLRDGDEVVVARWGGASFRVPKRITYWTWWSLAADLTSGQPTGPGLTVTVEVVDGVPVLRELRVDPEGEVSYLTPQELQRLPWKRLIEAAIESQAVDDNGRRSPRQVALERERAARAQKRRERYATDRQVKVRGGAGRTRRPSTTAAKRSQLQAVIDAVAEAGTVGRSDRLVYAADTLGYSEPYTRELHAAARRAGYIAGNV